MTAVVADSKQQQQHAKSGNQRRRRHHPAGAWLACAKTSCAWWKVLVARLTLRVPESKALRHGEITPNV